ncbi:hypothetical protein GGX14DRAFT_412615 [Mycena pura]|uniref:Uncharacterized protein n=1 Tax=Mycena pura TaxID=153505 RepID=A0AAD6YS77_9AGAR|nr:hypothetical protein GGX14DRAFT_412615 [Mycena pura]
MLRTVAQNPGNYKDASTVSWNAVTRCPVWSSRAASGRRRPRRGSANSSRTWPAIVSVTATGDGLCNFCLQLASVQLCIWPRKEYGPKVQHSRCGADFFEDPELPSVPAKNRTDATDSKTCQLQHHLDLANFAKKSLEKLGYAYGHRIIMTRQALPLFICAIDCSAQTDVCILDTTDIPLLVQEDERLDNGDDPELQVTVDAIAAIQRNSLTRVMELHLLALDTMMIPAITMYGTFPIFYKTNVTTSLNDAVKLGVFPEVATMVYRHIPRLPRRNSDGVKHMDNRPILLQ